MTTPDSSMAGALVSCLCVTFNRVPMLKRAVACFTAQTHPGRELVVVLEPHDHATRAYINGLARPDIRIVEGPAAQRLSLGARRNLGVANCRGDFIAVWDDDDWHSPRRLETQLKVIQLSGLPACTLRQVVLWDSYTRQAMLAFGRQWECALLVRRDTMPSYADLDRGEDTSCVSQICEKGLLAWAEAPHCYVYVYHGKNAGPRSHFRRKIFDPSYPLSAGFASRVAELLEHPVEASPLAAAEINAALVQR